jgi:drug/metabolite transporter superfamily protein YnfA
MKYTLPALFGLIGLFTVLLPPRLLLSSDKKAGYWIYKRVLGSSGDEARAVRAAGIFYKAFGGVLIVFALFFLWTA